jgi:hypothetical protein
MAEIETTTLRPRPWPAFLLLFFAVVSGLLLWFGNAPPGPGFPAVPIMFAVAALVIWYLLGKSKIMIDNYGLTNTTIFGTKEVDWQSIVNTYVIHERRGKTSRSLWCFETTGKNRVQFSIKFYSAKSLQVLGRAVTAKAASAHIDNTIFLIADGKVPWRLFQGA